MSYLAEGDDVIATVSLVYGHFEDRVKVVEVRVTTERPAIITQLRSYGVEPITLAIVPLDPSLALPLVTEEPSGQLDVRVDPVGANTSLFRIVIRNQSAKALRAIDYAVYEGSRRLATGRRKQERNEPLVPAGGEYAFDYWTSRSSSKGPNTPDRLTVTSVMWEDGSVDGEQAGAARERAMAMNRGHQLERLLDGIGAEAQPPIEVLRSAFGALDKTDYALEHERADALAALDEFERDRDVTGLRSWTSSKRADLLAWLARVNHALQ